MDIYNAKNLGLLILTTCLFTVEFSYADPVLARWEAHQIEFKYRGFTTAYTCNGIESKLSSIMKGLGARDDIRVEARCARGINMPSEIIDIQMAFAIPVPADESEITAETFQAEWQEYHLKRRHPRRLEAGDCELIEELNKYVFPQMGAKNIDDKTRCFPHSVNLHGINTKMTLLMPVSEEETKRFND